MSVPSLAGVAGTLLASTGRAVRIVMLGFLLFGLAAPSIVVLLLSFSNDAFLKFPPDSWGVSHYVSVFRNHRWRESLVRSLEVAFAASALAVVVGSAFVFGVHRTRLRRSAALDLLVLGPVIVPAVAYALALYSLYAYLGMLGTRMGLVIAHALLALPFVVLILGAALSRIPREIEYASLSLGASRWTTYRRITLPLIAAGLAAAAIFAFVTSFDEAVFVSFLAGPGFTTLQLEIFNSLQFGLDPAITAIAAILTVGTAVIMGVAALVRRGAAR